MSLWFLLHVATQHRPRHPSTPIPRGFSCSSVCLLRRWIVGSFTPHTAAASAPASKGILQRYLFPRSIRYARPTLSTVASKYSKLHQVALLYPAPLTCHDVPEQNWTSPFNDDEAPPALAASTSATPFLAKMPTR
ncbi:unnamed protein product [Fusarium graminearum]|uniref:Uncharacterized protein n=2 Tax=Gibberella zeae TaxID=5518 RepID=A0A098D4X7_GIBZE|nr:unnamed protein product [Fusarium graminearum]CAF3595488.1 unnamed protein product [Fusarium graminearum]CAF3596622.1 unnamed protein product [Fusarium graminearum]CAG1981238.1 unnamed protein product [Fusarium graminearum]CAG1984238.1 unnamed protein product [Fusarium graminearum]